MTAAGGAMNAIHVARNNGKRDLFGLDKWDRQRKFNVYVQCFVFGVLDLNYQRFS